MKPLEPKEHFVGLETCTWLYSGAETPVHKDGLKAVHEYLKVRGEGPVGRSRNAEIEQECKENIAELVHHQPENIAFLSNCSEAISMIAQSMDWKEGDNVVINNLEFPSGVLPWIRLKEIGVELRVVSHRNWEVSIDDILSRVDERTRMVITSHVSYLTGARIDYRKLYGYLKTTNTLLLLDVTQSLGAVSVDMNETDFIVCSSYKWLLSIHGMGILGVNPERTSAFFPKSIGWRSIKDMFSENRFESFDYCDDARRFELGFPSYATIYAMNYSSGLIRRIGVDRIESHILELGGQLIERLQALGYEVMTPVQPERRAGNICVSTLQGEEIAQRLLRDKVFVWGGDGRFRASVHLFNDTEDVSRLLHSLTDSYNFQK
ncbi:aminotransferase class V-fold PLP-dependent enzyme [Paenibacillus chungangensis]|uniref:Aminotransferase class V-fold PLP-dependent enzyme n=1 Tax=Paenibacillus chungangensis TaxID=696535 RepID=A0ABW3HRP5_9BACL